MESKKTSFSLPKRVTILEPEFAQKDADILRQVCMDRLQCKFEPAVSAL
jgi:hypothetical protein